MKLKDAEHSNSQRSSSNQRLSNTVSLGGVSNGKADDWFAVDCGAFTSKGVRRDVLRTFTHSSRREGTQARRVLTARSDCPKKRKDSRSSSCETLAVRGARRVCSRETAWSLERAMTKAEVKLHAVCHSALATLPTTVRDDGQLAHPRWPTTPRRRPRRPRSLFRPSLSSLVVGATRRRSVRL